MTVYGIVVAKKHFGIFVTLTFQCSDATENILVFISCQSRICGRVTAEKQFRHIHDFRMLDLALSMSKM